MKTANFLFLSFAAVLLCSFSTHAFAQGEPQWKYNFNSTTKTIEIKVSTEDMKNNEVMTQGVCKMKLYLRSTGSKNPQDGTPKEYQLKVPIKAQTEVSQTFHVDSDVVRVKGVSMKWEVHRLGSNVGQQKPKDVANQQYACPKCLLPGNTVPCPTCPKDELKLPSYSDIHPEENSEILAPPVIVITGETPPQDSEGESNQAGAKESIKGVMLDKKTSGPTRHKPISPTAGPSKKAATPF